MFKHTYFNGNQSVIFLKYEDIPSYLHQSQFYLSLCADNLDDEISVPSECFKSDDTVLNLHDFAQLLWTMVFWGFDKVPVTVLHFCANTELSEWTAITMALPDKGELHELLTSYFGAGGNIIAAVNTGRREFLDFWIAKHPNGIYKNNKYKIQHYGALGIAARMGNLPLMMELQRHYQWKYDECKIAGEYGHLDCLKFAHEVGGVELYSDAFALVARGGHLDCLKYFHENGCEWNSDVTAAAAEHGHLECLRYLHENGCPWDEELSRVTSVKCLQYALDNGCPVADDACALSLEIVEPVSLLQLQRDFKAGCNDGGLYDMIRLLRATRDFEEKGFPIVDDVYSESSDRSNPLALLQLLRAHNAPWNENVAAKAAECDLSILQFVMQNNCPYVTNEVLLKVVTTRNIENLKYLIDDMALPYSVEMFSIALYQGDVECVQYLVDVGCPCEYRIVENDSVVCGADDDIMQCIQYTTERGWPCSYDLAYFIFHHDLPLCHTYMQDDLNVCYF